MRKSRLLILCAVVALGAFALGACTASPVAELDLRAQRAEQKAITAEWLVYVDADPNLSTAQKTSRHDTAEAQDLRIRKAETAAGIPR